MPGTNVVVTAATIDPAVTQVTFLWKNPAGGLVFSETVAVFTNGTLGSGQIERTPYTNVLVKFAISDYMPNIIGDWGVQALFQGAGGQTIQEVANVLAIRATSFNVIPEIPNLRRSWCISRNASRFRYQDQEKKPKVKIDVNRRSSKESPSRS